MGNLTAIIAADTTGLRKAVEDAKKVLDKYTDAQDEATKALKKNDDIQNSAIKSYQRVVNNLNKVTNGSLSTSKAEKILTEQVKELRIQYANLSDTAKKSDFGKQLSKSCEDAQNHLQDLRKQLESVKEEHEKTTQASDNTGFSFDKVAGIVSKYAAQLAIAKGALDVLKTSLLSTESNIDEWGRTVSKASAAYSVFTNALGKGIDDFADNLVNGNIFDTLKKAMKDAADAYDLDDAVGTMENLDKVAIAHNNRRIAELKARKAAGEKINESEIKSLQEQNKLLLQRQANAAKASGEKSGANIIQQQAQNPLVTDDVAQGVYNQIITGGSKAFEDLQKEASDLMTKSGRRNSKGQWEESISNLTEAEQARYYAIMAAVDAESKLNEAFEKSIKAEEKLSELASFDVRANKLSGGSKSSTTTSTTSSIKLNVSPINIGRTEKQIKDDIKKIQDKIENTPDGALRVQLISQKEKLEKELKDFGKDPIQIKLETDAKNMDLSNLKSTKVSIGSDGSFKDGVNGIQDMIGASEEFYDIWADIFENWEDMSFGEQFFAMADAISQTVSSIAEFAQGIQTITSLLGSLKAAQTATTQSNIANNNAEMASNTGKLASESGLAIAEATESGSSLPFPANIAAIAAGVAAVIAAISMIGSFADGGIIQGTSSLGDMNIARVNGGEMILNGRQQANLFNLLNSGGSVANATGGSVDFRISGDTLYGVLRNHAKINSTIGKNIGIV